MVLTVYIMYPTALLMLDRVSGLDDFTSSTDNMIEAANLAKEPLRDFLIKHSEVREREFFLTSIKKMLTDDRQSEISSNDLVVLIPAFTISELTSAFQIGFLIFLPFIVIDLVIANILMAMGMMMLSPTIVSLPFKLLLFVLVEGWTKLAHGLVISYL